MPRNDVNDFDYLYEIGDFGLEVEISDINRSSNSFQSELNRLLPGYKRAHDASCETPIYSLFGIPIVTTNDKETSKLCLFMREEVLGGEIVSPIIPSSESWSEHVYKLTDLLFRYGETNTSSRDSMHVHVNVGKAVGLETIKNLLHLSAAYESILYRLGGLGRENRGEENSYIYQRPYLGNSPPVIKMDGGRKYPIAVFDDLMSAETKSEFFDRLGDTTYHASRGTRYVTQRYFGVNFYSIPIYGTIEFRTMNKTLNPEWIISWIAFCRAIVKKAVYGIRSSVDNVYRPLFDNKDISLHEFTSVLDSLPLTTETIKVLRDIWKESPMPQYDNKWRYSHLREPTYFSSGRYYPDSINSNVYKPKFVDVRHIQLESLNNFQARNLDIYNYNDNPIQGNLTNRWKELFLDAIDNVNGYWDMASLPDHKHVGVEYDEYYFSFNRVDDAISISIEDYKNDLIYNKIVNIHLEGAIHMGRNLRVGVLINALYDDEIDNYGFSANEIQGGD